MRRFWSSLVLAAVATLAVAAPGRTGGSAPTVRLDDLGSRLGWRAGDVEALLPGTASGAEDTGSCISPDDDRCEAWTATWSPLLLNTAPYANDSASTAEMAPDGNRMYVAGTTSPYTGYADVAVAAFDPSTGARPWVRTRDGMLGLSDEVRDVAVSPDSSKVFVTGAAGRERPSVGTDLLTIGFNASDGSALWTKTLDPGGGPDTAYSVGISPDSSMVVIGGVANNDPVAAAYDATSGAHLWTFTEGGSEQEAAYHVAVGTTAAYLLASDDSGSSWDTVIHAISLSNGSPLWKARFDGGGGETPWRVAIDEAEGRLYTASVMGVQPQGTDYGVAAFDLATGTELWRTQLGGAVTEVVNIPTSLVVDTAPGDTRDRLFVSGLLTNTSFGNYDFGTFALDAATGQTEWSAVYGSERDERVWDVALSPDGRSLYVTGRSGPPYTGGASGGSGTDAATVAYDALDGTRRWAARASGATASELGGDPVGVGVGAGGSRVVVGASMLYDIAPERAGNIRDFFTVGYTA